MDHPTPAAAGKVFRAPTRGFAVASVALGYFSLIVFFWKPFGLILASVGFTLGVVSWLMGNRGGLRERGEPNLAVIGTLVCGFNAGLTATLYKMLGTVQWGAFDLGF
ncbi:MAG: hypothetical protein K2P78_14685 [Gemmataceae bacterium]|nr:hypothetical protein [Gemmataceae bacterium]